MWFLFASVASGWELDEDAHWMESHQLELDGVTVTLGSGLGWAVRREASDPAPVGWVFVGDVDADLSVRRPGVALALAHALDGEVGDPSLRELVDHGRWTQDGDVLVVLDPAAGASALDPFPTLVRDRQSLGWIDEAGTWNILVMALTPDRDRGRGQSFLRTQALELAAAGLDPGRAMDEDALRPGDPRRVVMMRTPRRWTGLLEPAVRAPGDDALVWWHDPTGAVDSLGTDSLLVHGRATDGAPRVRVLERSGQAPAGIRVDHGAVNVVVRQGAGLAHQVDHHARLVLTADAPAGSVTLDLPRREDDTIEGLIPVPSALEVQRIAVDGVEAEVRDGGFGLAADGGRRVTVVLPRPLAAREEAVLDVEWSEQWAAARILELQPWAKHEMLQLGLCDSDAECSAAVASLPTQADLGQVTAQRPVLPTVPWQDGSWPAEIRVGTVLGSRWRAGVGGSVPELLASGDGRWWVVDGTSRSRVSFGAMSEVVSPPLASLPGVRILSHHPFAGGSPVFVRAALAFFQPVLPPWPVQEVVLVQEPDVPKIRDLLSAISVQDGRGHDSFRGALQLPMDGGFVPDSEHVLERDLVEALVADAWADLPSAAGDEWLRAALPQLYRDLFVRYAWGEEELAAFDAERRVAMSSAPRVPLDGAQPGAGLGVLLALRDRVGEPALLEAVDRWTRGGDPSADALQASLEAVWARELDGFFDAWVTGGISPKVDGSWTRDGQRLDVTLDVSPRWGTWEVPLTLEGRRGRKTTWVEVVDGHAEVSLTPGLRVESITVDGERWLPIRGGTLPRRDGAAD